VTDIKDRAVATVQKRLRGSFGYRAAESIVNGFDGLENLTVFKAHEGTKDELPRLLDLVIERLKPVMSAKDTAKALNMDIGEAQAALDEETEVWEEAVENRTKYLTTLNKAFDKAPSEYTELSAFSVDNYVRILDRVTKEARKQYIRSGNEEWAKAITEASQPVYDAVMKFKAAA
jgi:hypothetical protein